MRMLEKHIAGALCLPGQSQELMNKETLADLGHSLGEKHKQKFQQMNELLPRGSIPELPQGSGNISRSSRGGGMALGEVCGCRGLN